MYINNLTTIFNKKKQTPFSNMFIKNTIIIKIFHLKNFT